MKFVNLATFRVSTADLDYTGTGLVRPECVLATAQGSLFTSHWQGGVSRIAPDGSVTHIGVLQNEVPHEGTLRPNGIALRPDGSFLLAHLGDTAGGVYHLTRRGILRPFLLEVNGAALHPTNFVMMDGQGRVWITVSTTRIPRKDAYRPDVDDGYIVLLDKNRARIVARGIGFANECRIDPTGEWLYVNETFARRLVRFPLAANGSLGPRDVVAEFGHGTYPDGLEFDVEGGAWITSIVSNRVIRVDREGRQQVVLEEAHADYLEAMEQDYLAGRLDFRNEEGRPPTVLRNLSSLAFGGANLRRAYLGSLQGDRVPFFDAPVAGHPPPHWEWGW